MWPSRRAVRVLLVAAALLAAYAGGLATGAVSGGSGQHSSSGTGGVIDEAESKILNDSAHQVSRADLERAAVEGMLQALGDRWSNYFGPTEYASFQSVLSGRYAGVGIWVRRDADGAVRIVSVQEGSPAAKAGLRADDVLLTVAGRSVDGRTVADIVSDLRGASGTDVTMTTQRAGHTATYTLRRATLDSDDVGAKVFGTVMIIKVSAFTQGVGARVAAFDAEARADALTGIVLDLRGNPGGLLDEAVKTASVFLDGGVVAAYQQRAEKPTILYATTGGDTATPLAVLVDGGTASAAEVVTGALQDRNRAVVVGSRTFGKGSVQQPTQLSDGSGLELTVGHYLTPSGREVDGVGIAPDVEVDPSSAPSVAESRAVEVLSGLLADAGAGGRG